MFEPPMLQIWERLIARLWLDGRTGKDDGDTRVTFIAGPPHEFLRVLSQQENIEPVSPPTDQQAPLIYDQSSSRQPGFD